jgi:hypothetical protein
VAAARNITTVSTLFGRTSANSVAAAQTELSQLLGRSGDFLAQASVRQRRPARHDDRQGLGPAELQQVIERAAHVLATAISQYGIALT